MATGDVVFEATGAAPDKFSVVEETTSGQYGAGYNMRIGMSFKGGTGLLNGSTVTLPDATFDVFQDRTVPWTGAPAARVEASSPFGSSKTYKITITEV